MARLGALLAAALLCAAAVAGEQQRVLVLLDDPASMRESHSKFLGSLTQRGYSVDVKALGSKQLQLRQWDDWLCDKLVIFGRGKGERPMGRWRPRRRGPPAAAAAVPLAPPPLASPGLALAAALQAHSCTHRMCLPTLCALLAAHHHPHPARTPPCAPPPPPAALGGAVDAAQIVDFVDSGRDLLLAVDSGVSEELRALAEQLGVDVDVS